MQIEILNFRHFDTSCNKFLSKIDNSNNNLIIAKPTNVLLGLNEYIRNPKLVQEEEHFSYFSLDFNFLHLKNFPSTFPPHPYRNPYNTTSVKEKRKRKRKRKVVLLFSVASSSSSSSSRVLLFLVLHFVLLFWSCCLGFSLKERRKPTTKTKKKTLCFVPFVSLTSF